MAQITSNSWIKTKVMQNLRYIWGTETPMFKSTLIILFYSIVDLIDVHVDWHFPSCHSMYNIMYGHLLKNEITENTFSRVSIL